MRIYLTILVLIFTPACISHQDAIAQEIVSIRKIDSESGLPSEYFAYKDSKGREVRHGSFILRYRSGAKYLAANYVRGELDGMCTIFTEEGKVEVEGEYRRGTPWSGEFQIGHEIRNYAQGRLIGSRTD